MALLVRHFGVLRKIISNGLFANDPHATVLEVEVHDSSDVLPSIRWSAVTGASVIQLLVVLPLPPLLPPMSPPPPPSSLPLPPLPYPSLSLPLLPPLSSPPPPPSTLPLPPSLPLSPSASTRKTSLRSPATNRVLSSAIASEGEQRKVVPNTMETPQLSLVWANEGAFEAKSSYIATPHNEDDTVKMQRARSQRPRANGRTKNSVLVYSRTRKRHRTRRRPYTTLTLAEVQAYLDGEGKVHQSKETPTIMKIAEAIEAYREASPVEILATHP